MKKCFLLLLMFINYHVAFSQEQPEDLPPETYHRPGRAGGLYGKVVETQTNKGIQAAAKA